MNSNKEFLSSEGCYQSEEVVVKSIRLHYNNMLPWIINTDIKIVQLVRDPRATLNSQFAYAILPSSNIINNF